MGSYVVWFDEIDQIGGIRVPPGLQRIRVNGTDGYVEVLSLAARGVGLPASGPK